MASRGRGRQANSLTNEQLQALGCVGKDMPPVLQAPPPTFPPLMNKPINLEITSAQNYQILWKEDFLNHMRDYYLTPIPKKTTDHKYSDHYNKLLENTRTKCKLQIPWECVPTELLMGKRSNTDPLNKVKKKMMRNDKVLSQLDSIDDGEVSDDNAEHKKQSETDSEKEDNEGIENEDDEMDDENDYGNNYFDNGEAFNEEDDNMDDGPIY